MKTLLQLWQDWRIFRINRAYQRAWNAEQDRRGAIKGKIIRVGTMQFLPSGQWWLDGWEICIANGALCSRFDANGRYYFCGYSTAELQQIAVAPAEWVDQPT